MDLITLAVHDAVAQIQEQHERVIRTTFRPEWPRYLTPFPAGAVPIRLAQPIANRLSNKFRRQVRCMRSAMKLLRSVYAQPIREDFSKSSVYCDIRVSILCA